MRAAIALIFGLIIVCSPQAGPHPLTLPSPPRGEGRVRGDKSPGLPKQVAESAHRGLDWLSKNQSKDGSWGKQYSIAVTSFASLAYLSSSDEPFAGVRGKALTKGLNFLLAQQKARTTDREIQP